jgi:hypothetical protein
VIQTLAEDLTARLMRRDPLSERVHHNKLDLMLLLISATIRFIGTRGAQHAPLAAGGKQ